MMRWPMALGSALLGALVHAGCGGGGGGGGGGGALPTNQPPSPGTVSVAGDEDTSIPLTLTGTDPEGRPLTFRVVSPPTNGTLGGSPPQLTYTPAANWNGTDTFTFEVSDGTLVQTGQASLVVRPVN